MLNFLIIISIIFILQVFGQQVTFKKTDLDYPPHDLIWCGKSKDTIFIKKEGAKVYK